MRTTVLMDDDLYADVRRVAAQEGCTITSLMEEAMRELLRRRGESAASAPYRVRPLKGRLQPGVDLDDNAALARLMDED